MGACAKVMISAVLARPDFETASSRHKKMLREERSLTFPWLSHRKNDQFPKAPLTLRGKPTKAAVSQRGCGQALRPSFDCAFDIAKGVPRTWPWIASKCVRRFNLTT